MCGIAGIIYRDGGGERKVGRDMTAMLQAMKHRGPDSTGYALYRPESDGFVMHVKLMESNNGHAEFEFAERLRRQRAEVESRVVALGAQVTDIKPATDHAMTITFGFDGDLKQLADYVEDVRDTEVLSLGKSLEIVKDLGDAKTVAGEYHLDDFVGTHAIGHVRMATESDVDICSAHPFWAYPFQDVKTRAQSYWRDVGTIEAYFEANMDLRSVDPCFNLYNRSWPLRTAGYGDPPAKFVFDEETRRGVAINSIVEEGTIISGSEVRRSVIGRNVRVHSYSLIEDSIIMDWVEIGRNCKIRRTIIDKHNTIPSDAVIGYDMNRDNEHYFVSEGGIVVVPRAQPKKMWTNPSTREESAS